MKKFISLSLLLLSIACATRTANLDPTRESKDYDANYNYTDLRAASQQIVDQMLTDEPLAKASEKPTVIVYGIQNRTSEHLDLKSLEDRIKVLLSESKKVQFSNKDVREFIENEMDYQATGKVSKETMIRFGKQIGADYILSGSLSSIEKNEGRGIRLTRKKLVYYKLSISLTDIHSNIESWLGDVELAREESKPLIGW